MERKEKVNMPRASDKVPKKLPRKSLVSRFDWVNRFRHWYMGGASLTRSIFRVKAAWQTISVIIVILSMFFVVAAFYTKSGEFVINLDSEMAEGGFYLSDTPDYSEHLVSLHGTAVIDAFNINIFDIMRNVNEIDGEHNGRNYVAYTFYLTNDTGAVRDYKYSLNIRGSEKGADKAMWIMVFRNDENIIYAMNGKDGVPESQLSMYNFPFQESSKFKEEQYSKVPLEEVEHLLDKSQISIFNKSEEVNKLTAIPFKSESIVCEDVVEGIENQAQDKFTVVIWYEGEDPECTDDILGGWVELYMNFNLVE